MCRESPTSHGAGLINRLRDVRTIMHNSGSALMASASRPASPGSEAAKTRSRARSSRRASRVRRIILNITGGPELGLFEVNEAAEIVHNAAHQDANLISAPL